jgi:hypothetical protein
MMYLIQHYVIKFVSNLRQVNGFLQVLWFPPPIKLTKLSVISQNTKQAILFSKYLLLSKATYYIDRCDLWQFIHEINSSISHVSVFSCRNYFRRIYNLCDLCYSSEMIRFRINKCLILMYK